MPGWYATFWTTPPCPPVCAGHKFGRLQVGQLTLLRVYLNLLGSATLLTFSHASLIGEEVSSGYLNRTEQSSQSNEVLNWITAKSVNFQ